jgi:hypothetical protein
MSLYYCDMTPESRNMTMMGGVSLSTFPWQRGIDCQNTSRGDDHRNQIVAPN